MLRHWPLWKIRNGSTLETQQSMVSWDLASLEWMMEILIGFVRFPWRLRVGVILLVRMLSVRETGRANRPTTSQGRKDDRRFKNIMMQ